MNVTHATETAATGTGGAAAIPPTRNEHLKWIFSLLCAAVILTVCVVAGLPRPACWFFSLTVLAICLWGFSLLPDGLVAVMLPMGYILSGVGTPAQVLSPWTKPMGWMILGGLMTGLVLQHTGLARRIALWALHVTGSSFRRLLWGILLAGFIIAPLMPTSTGKCILLGIICIGICDAMGFKARSREASTLLMAGYLAVAGPRMGLYTGAGEVTLNLQMLATAGVHVSWLEYFLQNFAPSVVYSVLSIVVLRLVMRPRSTVDARVWVEEQYAGLGPMSLREKKALALFAVLAVLMMTDKWHGINIGWIMMVVGFVGFLPGFDLVDGKKFATLNLTSVLFIVGCMSIGAAAQATGMDKSIARAVLPLLQGKGELGTVIASFFSGAGLNFLLTPVAAVSTFTVPLAEIAKALGINPLAPAYAFMLGLDQYVLPYEYAAFLYMFSTGYINFKDMVLVFAWRALMALIVLILVFYPFWKLTGAA